MTESRTYALPKLATEMARLLEEHPLGDAVVDRVDGRRIRIGEHWLDDFASCNYLGLDLDPEVIAGIPDYLARWGTHPSWARGIASLALYGQIEAEVRELLRAEDVLALPTLTHVHFGVLPALAGEGTLLVDLRAHQTIHDGAVLAKQRGAVLRRFRHNDVDHAERLLRAARRGPRIICLDGINSMTGNPPDLPAFAALAREHDALLYLDDAHGFGVIGDRDGYEPTPYGRSGNAIVRFFGESYDQVVLTAGFSKAYSSLLAFVACPSDLKNVLKVTAAPYLYSGPSPIASLASALVGLQVNDARGDQLRARIHAGTRRILDHLTALGVATRNTSAFPIVEVPLADADDLDLAGRFLFDHGIYATLAFYPGVPRDEVGFRLQVTAANTDEELDRLLEVVDELAAAIPLRSAASHPFPGQAPRAIDLR